MSACWILPLGLGVARRPISRKGSSGKSAGGAAVKGSRRAAALPRCDNKIRSPLAMRRSTPLAFFRNSSMVTVFMWLKFKLNLKYYQSRRENALVAPRVERHHGTLIAPRARTSTLRSAIRAFVFIATARGYSERSCGQSPRGVPIPKNGSDLPGRAGSTWAEGHGSNSSGVLALLTHVCNSRASPCVTRSRRSTVDAAVASQSSRLKRAPLSLLAQKFAPTIISHPAEGPAG